MHRIPRAVLLVALALGLVAPGGEARSAENGDFSLRPVRPAEVSERDRAYVVKAAAAGSTFEDTLEARNLTDAPLDLVVEPVDATVTADGAFAAAATRDAVGGWITTTPSEVRVPAQGSRRVKIRVTVPADAPNGDHIAAVVVRRANAGTGQGTVRVVEQVGVRVYLTVTGGRGPGGDPATEGQSRAFELRALRWTGTAQKRAFEADVANVGSLLVEPLGTLTIGQGDLDTELQLPVLGTVLPGKTTTLRIQSEGRLEPGTYEARLRLHDVHGGPEHEASTTFSVAAAAADDKAPPKKTRFPLWPALLATAGLTAVTVQLVRRRFTAAG